MSSSTFDKRVPSLQTREQLAEAGKEIQDKAKDARQAVQEKATELKDAVTEGAADVWNTVKDAGHEVGERATVEFAAARDVAEEYVDEGFARVRELSGAAERQIRSQPMTSILVAVGAGFLFGALWCRR